jgi:hypothetical protein
MFDDEEARRMITDQKIKIEARFDQQAKAQLDLANQIQRQAEENARLRGQIETLNYELETAKKRQQDFYLDLDTRLRKFEGQANAAAAVDPANGANSKPAGDPAKESQEYEAALNQFKGGKYKEAAVSGGLLFRNIPTVRWRPMPNIGWATPGMPSAIASGRSRHKASSPPSTPKRPRRRTPGWPSRPASRKWVMRQAPSVRWKPLSASTRLHLPPRTRNNV